MPEKYLYKGKEIDRQSIEGAANQSGMDVSAYIKKAGIQTMYDQYSYKGKAVSLSDVSNAANESGMSVDAYIKKSGIQPYRSEEQPAPDQDVKKKVGGAVVGANSGATPLNGGSQSSSPDGTNNSANQTVTSTPTPVENPDGEPAFNAIKKAGGITSAILNRNSATANPATIDDGTQGNFVDKMIGIHPKANKLIAPNNIPLDIVNTPDVPAESFNAGVKSLQQKLVTNTLTPDDVKALSGLTGKMPEAITAYASGDTQKGVAYDNAQQLQKQREELVGSVNHFNLEFGEKYNPEDVLSSPQKTSDFAQQVQERIAQRRRNQYNALALVTEGGSAEDVAKAQVANLGNILDTKSFVSKASQYQSILIDHANELNVIDGEKNGFTKEQILANISKSSDPKGYYRTLAAKASVPDVGNILSVAGAMYDKVFGDDTNDQLLEMQKGYSDIKYNAIQQKLANNEMTAGVISNNPEQVTQGRLRLAKTKENIDLMLEYPAILKQRIAQEASHDIAFRSGNLDETGSEATNWEGINEKITGADVMAIAATPSFQKYLQNPKTRDIALSMLSNPSLFSDASYLGGAGSSFMQPLKDLFNTTGDLTGFRSEKNRYTQAMFNQTFPSETPNMKGYVNTVRTGVNGASSLVMYGLMEMATAGLATPALETSLTAKAVQGLEGAEAVNAANAARVSAQKIAHHIGSYVSFAIPSIDGTYQQSFDLFPDETDKSGNIVESNDVKRKLFTGLTAVMYGELGRFMDFGKATKFNVEGVTDNLVNLVDGISKKTISEDAAKEFIDGKIVPRVNQFLERYATNVGKGASVMTGFNMGESMLKLAFGDKNTNVDTMLEGAGTAFVDGLLSMSVMGGFGAHADMVHDANNSMKGAIYSMSLNRDATKTILQKALNDGIYTKEEYNEKMQILNQSVSSYNSMLSETRRYNINLDQRQKAVYVANKTAEAVLGKQLDATSKLDVEKRQKLEDQINNLRNNSAAIMDGLKFNNTLQPINSLYNAQKDYEVALDKQGRGEVVDNIDELKDRYARLQKKYMVSDDNRLEGDVEQYKVNGLPSNRKNVQEILNRGQQEADKHNIEYTGGDNEMHMQLQTFGGTSVKENNAITTSYPSTKTTVSPKSRSVINTEGVGEVYDRLSEVANPSLLDPNDKQKSVEELQTMGLDYPTRLKSNLKGNESLTVDVIARNSAGDINGAIDAWDAKLQKGELHPSDKKGINEHIDLLQKALDRKAEINKDSDINGGEPDMTVGEMNNKTGTYKGKSGEFYTEDDGKMVFKEKGTGVIHELGVAEDLKDKTAKSLDITHDKSLVATSDNGDITVRGKRYINPFEERGQDSRDAITYDKDGGVKSVRMKSEDGKRRTFSGSIAEDIAYQIHLKEINKNNGTRTEFEQHIGSDESAQKEADNAQVSETAQGNATENNEPVPPEKVLSEYESVSNIKSDKVREGAMDAGKEKHGDLWRRAGTINDNFADIIKHLKDNNKIEVKCP